MLSRRRHRRHLDRSRARTPRQAAGRESRRLPRIRKFVMLTPPAPIALSKKLLAVPMPELWLLALDDRPGPVIGLEVEHLLDAAAVRRAPWREVGDPEVGDVLLGLVDSTQKGSAPGQGNQVPVPTSWIVQLNGLLPSHGANGPTGWSAAAGAAHSNAAATAIAVARAHIPRPELTQSKAILRRVADPAPDRMVPGSFAAGVWRTGSSAEGWRQSLSPPAVHSACRRPGRPAP